MTVDMKWIGSGVEVYGRLVELNKKRELAKEGALA